MCTYKKSVATTGNNLDPEPKVKAGSPQKKTNL